MALIRVQRDPARITACDDHQYNGNLLDWLIDNEPAGFDGLHCCIMLNNSILLNTAITDDGERLDELADVEVGEFDTVTIIIRPAGFDPITIAIVAAVIVGTVVLARALMPSIKTPTSEGATSNNQLNASSNNFRPNQAIPDIAGQVVSYPDFVQPSYYTYNAAGRRVFREVFCIGVGHYQLGVWKVGETPISDIPGSSVTVYAPGSMPTDLINVRNVESADNIELPVPGQSTRSVVVSSGRVYDDSIVVGAAVIQQLEVTAGNVLDLQLEILLNNDTYDTLLGLFTVVSVSGNTIIFGSTGVDDGQIIGGYIVNTNFQPTDAWYNLPGEEVTEVRAHLVMPAGIRSGDGEVSTVTATMQVERLNNGVPTGVVYERACTFSGNTQQPQAATFAIGPEFGLTEPGEFRAKLVRITAALGDNALDLLKLERLESVTPYTADFGFVTVAEVNRVTQQTGGASGSSNKVNVLATRKLQLFSGGTVSSTYTATRSFADYVFYLLYERMGVPLEYVDTAQLFGIRTDLSDPQLGYFDYTFDNADTSARERVQVACAVARVIPWNDGLVWAFVRDQAQPVRTTMFNRRNLKSAGHRYVQRFRRPADHDSVIVKYVDPDKNTTAQISRKILTSSIVPGRGVRPLEIDLVGCRNVLQATNRAELEVRRLIYQTVTVTDVALEDALYVQKGARVDWIDMYDGDLFDGEIIGVFDNVYRTSERFTPHAGIEYWVYVTDSTGATSNSVRAYPRPDGDIFGFVATGLTGVYLPTGDQQLGSRYVIASSNDMDASTFILDGRGRPNESRECELTLIEYNDNMYEMD
jgi:hypothetical protein